MPGGIGTEAYARGHMPGAIGTQVKGNTCIHLVLEGILRMLPEVVIFLWFYNDVGSSDLLPHRAESPDLTPTQSLRTGIPKKQSDFFNYLMEDGQKICILNSFKSVNLRALKSNDFRSTYLVFLIS